MPDWITEHRQSISFVVYLLVGVALIAFGLTDGDPAVVALGAGAIGLPGFRDASRSTSDET